MSAAGNRASFVNRSRSHGRQQRSSRTTQWSPALINVVGLTALVFFMGGSSRADVWSLPILRPVAILSLGHGLWALARRDIARHRFLFAMAAAVLALLTISLIPLPPFLWTAFGGRDIIVAIDNAAGLSGTWRPISMAPELTWNALFSLAVPLAILVHGVRLSLAEQRIAILTVLSGGALTMAMALVQIVGGGDPSLYLYRHSSFGEPSGLFSNRNHEALYLATLLPLLGYILSTRDRTSRTGNAVPFLVAVGLLVIIAFLLVLGSRAGLAAGMIGLGAFAVHAVTGAIQQKISRTRFLIGVVIAVAIVAIVAAALAMGNARSIQRVLASDSPEELRYLIWPVIAASVSRFMPFGSGIGSYERVFRIMEPDAILRPTYSNHAHNDWLEVALTGGLPGLALMGVAVTGFLVAAMRVRAVRSRRARAMGWTGLVIIFIAAIGSTIDYPLRTPVLSVLFALSCVWVGLSLRADGECRGVTPDGENRFEG